MLLLKLLLLSEILRSCLLMILLLRRVTCFYLRGGDPCGALGCCC